MVLISAPFPRGIRVGEVNLRPTDLIQLGEFRAIVKGDTVKSRGTIVINRSL